MTTSVMEAAATLPCIKTICVDFSDPGNPLDVVHWHPFLLQERLEDEKRRRDGSQILSLRIRLQSNHRCLKEWSSSYSRHDLEHNDFLPSQLGGEGDE